jgi:hypothetical protein
MRLEPLGSQLTAKAEADLQNRRAVRCFLALHATVAGIVLLWCLLPWYAALPMTALLEVPFILFSVALGVLASEKDRKP